MQCTHVCCKTYCLCIMYKHLWHTLLSFFFHKHKYYQCLILSWHCIQVQSNGRQLNFVLIFIFKKKFRWISPRYGDTDLYIKNQNRFTCSWNQIEWIKIFFHFSNDIWGLFFLFQGPLTVTIQELDGSFNHNFKIEENKTKFDITCHSKCRRYFLSKYFHCATCT